MSQVKQPVGAAGKKNGTSKPAGVLPAVPAKQGTSGSPVEENKSDLLTELWLRFGRFGWDAAGVGLIAFALITLVGLIGHSINQPWSKGFLISFWVNLISRAFGWGWLLAVLAIGILGAICLRRRFSHWPNIPLVRVLALEGLAFGLLTFLAIIGGFSLARADAGKDGGFIGWGLATLLDQLVPVPWGAVFIIVLMILFAGYGSGVMHWLLRHLESWLNQINPPAFPTREVDQVDAEEEETLAAAKEGAEAQAAPAVQIPRVRDPNLPPLNLLLSEENTRPDESYIQETAQQIEKTLAEFGVPATVKGYRVGPTVTQYALEPGFVEKTGPDGEIIRQKVRVSQISALSRDLALSLSAERLRIEAPVPGRAYMGIEVPNPKNSVVRLRPLMECEAFTRLTSPLAVALGKDVSGQPVVADLSRMPHLLIAGTTGSGKSVFIAALAACLVINNQPEDMRMAMLDPKMVELVRFNGLPHLFGRVETSVDRMLGVLRWAILEMERRYRLLEEARTRDIDVYNKRMIKRGQPKLPRIVVIVDELADLMMTAPDQTEHNLIRLAQMARATGIHLVVATQRPSTDVVTGLIKANFPARLAFSVASSIDSRVILDGNGAESLLGKGDMLFLNPESGTPVRAQGVLVADEELERVIGFWKQNRPLDSGVELPPWEGLVEQSEEDENSDALVEQAIKIVRASQRASTSLIQRRLRIGYPRAARLMDQLEDLGVVGPSQGGGRERDVLLPPDDGRDDEDFDSKDEK
jgi:DNA segregation ATPase FtsK/SpoIIIE, S-DNA-T family